MLCEFCGTQVAENGTFCPVCGKRVDGKKTCEKCGKAIPEQSTFCTYCGARVDGKKICEKCGAEVKENFCEKCGARYNAAEKSESVAAVKNTQTKGFKKVANFLAPTLLLAAILVIFVCSFFVGVNYKSIIDGEVSFSKSYGVFYFFGDVFKDIKSFADIVMEGTEGLYVAAITTTAVMALNLVVSLVMTVVAAIKYGVGLAQGEEVKIARYAAWAFASFMLAICAVSFFYGSSEIYKEIYDGEMYKESSKYGLSGGSIAGIVLGIVLIVVSVLFFAVSSFLLYFVLDWIFL